MGFDPGVVEWNSEEEWPAGPDCDSAWGLSTEKQGCPLAALLMAYEIPFPQRLRPQGSPHKQLRAPAGAGRAALDLPSPSPKRMWSGLLLSRKRES